jgi:hypothetical protein
MREEAIVLTTKGTGDTKGIAEKRPGSLKPKVIHSPPRVFLLCDLFMYFVGIISNDTKRTRVELVLPHNRIQNTAIEATLSQFCFIIAWSHNSEHAIKQLCRTV